MHPASFRAPQTRLIRSEVMYVHREEPGRELIRETRKDSSMAIGLNPIQAVVKIYILYIYIHT